MKESTTYQEILAEGEAKGRVETLQEVILELGARSYGPATATVQSDIRRIRDYGRLHEILLKVGEAASWNELLSASNGHPQS